VPVADYRRSINSHQIDRGFSMPVLATRGCPFQCTFCSSPRTWTTRYVMRDVEDVVEEVQDLVGRYRVKGIIIADLTAFTRRKWVLDLCRALKAREVDVSWQLPSGTRSEALDAEVLQALYDINCRDMTYAPESGSPATLRYIKKRVSLDTLAESVRASVAIGFVTKINIVIGFPNETRKNLLETALFILKMAWQGVYDCYPWLYSPYPGSELYEALVADGMIPPPSDEYFEQLHGISNLTVEAINVTRLPLWELNLYRLLMTLGFYAISYGRRPRRLWRLALDTVTPGFSPRNLLEQRLYEMAKRALA
jgi:radical SAM superfamily enzyme YgiQ (UPF0313 family)